MKPISIPTDWQEELESQALLQELGLAVFNAQALEYGLTSLFAATALRVDGLAGAPHLREIMDARYSQTLRRLVRDAAARLRLGAPLAEGLGDALAARNWLIHHFYREFAPAAFNPELRQRAIQRLRDVRTMLEAVNNQVHQVVVQRVVASGIPEELVEERVRGSTEEYIREQLESP